MSSPFGLNVSKTSNIPDIMKYDANSGRLLKPDYNAGEKTVVDITVPPPRFAMDLGRLEIGYIHYTSNGPDMRMVPVGQPLPPQPEDLDEKGRKLFRAGIHVLCYGKVLDGLRELSSTATCVLEAMELLYKQFQEAPEAAAGLVPIVELTRTVPVMFGKKHPKTSYAPVFTIVGWTERLPEMGERTVPPPGSPASDLSDDIPF